MLQIKKLESGLLVPSRVEAQAEESEGAKLRPQLEESLLSLCEGDSAAITALGSIKGLTSLLIFANLWDSEQEMLEELVPLGMPEEIARRIAKEAEKASEKDANAAATNYKGKAAADKAHVENVAIGSRPIPPEQAMKLAAQGSSSTECDETRRKLEKALDGIWTILIDAGSRSKLMVGASSLSVNLKS